MQGCPHFARTAGCATFSLWHGTPIMKKKVNGTCAIIPTPYTKWLCAIMCLEVQKLAVVMGASKSPVQSVIAKVSVHGEFGRLYIWSNGWEGR